MLLFLLSLAEAGVFGKCSDNVLTNTGLGGGGGTVTALLNVTSQAACCAFCHGTYHDECAGWTYGESGDDHLSYNCAIMATNGKPSHVPGHSSGVIRSPPVPPPVSGSPCNSDDDCNPLDAKQWRCLASSAAKTTKENNCHLTGPYATGNSTCACANASSNCGTPSPVRPHNATAKQYLMIGDSISEGMKPDLNLGLASDGVELTHNPGNAASSNWGVHCLDRWLQEKEREWDVISFQFGLHDLGFDIERISVATYAALLTNITDRLMRMARKSPKTKLIWVTTTPVPTVPTYDGSTCNDTKMCLNPPRFDDDVALYNEAAARIMAKASEVIPIKTVDLYSFVLKRCGGHGYKQCDGFQLPMNVHFEEAGWTALAAQMHAAVLGALGEGG